MGDLRGTAREVLEDARRDWSEKVREQVSAEGGRWCSKDRRVYCRYGAAVFGKEVYGVEKCRE